MIIHYQDLLNLLKNESSISRGMKSFDLGLFWTPYLTIHIAEGGFFSFLQYQYQLL